MRNPEQVITWLREQEAVDYVTTISRAQVVLLMTRSEKLVEGLEKRGATARWYDRTEWSTKAGKSKADFQCEVLLGERFWAQEEAA